MNRPRWTRLREATAASTEPALQRSGANSAGVTEDADGDYDNDGVMRDCPKCTSGLMPDGSTCPECNGAGVLTGKVRESEVYWLRESVTQADRDKAKAANNSLPDGSYPINNIGELKSAAVLAASHHGDYEAARRLITRRAKELGVSLESLPGFGKAKESARIGELEAALAGVTERLREAGSEVLGSTYAPITAATTPAGSKGYEVVLIREGMGNSDDGRYYTRHAVQELVSSGVCEGMQAYADHPSLDEEEFLPERSVRDMVGSYSNVRLAESSGGLAEARAVFVPVKGNGYEWVESLAEAAVGNRTGRPLVGISLYGAAAGEDRTRPDGSFGPMADLIRPTSGDIVTNAGAGGEFVKRLMESARAKRASNTETKGRAMKLKELTAKMAESAKKLREAGTDAERTTALDELDALAKANIEAEEPKLGDLTVEKLQESAPALLSTIRESAKAEVKIPANAPEADAALRTENEGLTSKLREAETKIAEKDKSIADTNAALTGIKVLREAKVAQEDVEFYLGKIREAGAHTEDAMKAVIEAEQAREQRIVQRVRESAGLDFVEGNPGSAGKPGETGLLDLSEDGVPMVEPEKEKTAA